MARRCWPGLPWSVWASPASAAAADLRLVDAVKRQDRAAVRTLLKQNADVKATQPDGATALHWAAHWDDLERPRCSFAPGPT